MTNETSPQASPLTEATPNSIDMLLSEMNQALIEGMPEKITDEKLQLLIEIYRSQADKWNQQEIERKAAGPRRKKLTGINPGISDLLDDY